MVWTFLSGDETTLAPSILFMVNFIFAGALNVSLTVSCSANAPVATQQIFSFLFEWEISFLFKSGDGSCVLSKTER